MQCALCILYSIPDYGARQLCRHNHVTRSHPCTACSTYCTCPVSGRAPHRADGSAESAGRSALRTSCPCRPRPAGVRSAGRSAGAAGRVGPVGRRPVTRRTGPELCSRGRSCHMTGMVPAQCHTEHVTPPGLYPSCSSWVGAAAAAVVFIHSITFCFSFSFFVRHRRYADLQAVV